MLAKLCGQSATWYTLRYIIHYNEMYDHFL